MGYLKNNGYQVITLDDFVEGDKVGKKFPHNTVVITFDDGYIDNYTNAVSHLRSIIFQTSHFFQITGNL